ncbi:MAG TPA: HlyD family efflux transporter periplasmic adaptor subunit [Brevundimonas sp.]|uniref:HlyD family secretion protein n=1 Tax=Brevundimonas sp. TaxID=1871086 RepID=UPI002C151D60|nr:HlyD family efflux transporter periplasmic adaptor subunit [Brevundimonas sp.]HRH19696.1 HlyD family efflux transporter periplasmic adaptor subunit [Brevundimonas sp.]
MFGFLKRPIFWIILVVAVLVVGGGYVMVKGGEAKKAELEAAAAEEVESPYAAIASGRADVEGGIIEVAARRGGVVQEVYVQEGDRVVAGQILARQEDEEARLAVSRAHAEVGQVQSQLASLQVNLSAARRELARLQELAPTNFVAAQRLDQARDTVASAEAAIEAQQATIITAQARQREAEYNLELTIIRAPMSGRIARRYAQPGAGASTLNVSTMFDLEPDTQRIVRAEIVESDLPNVTIGQQVEITPENDPTRIYVGRVLRRATMFGARQLQSDTPGQQTDERVVEVVVAVDDGALLIGQRVLVKFMRRGQAAGAERPVSPGVGPEQAMQTPERRD